jgi:UDP-N-acetylglucosamine 2-epimerase (non-hydrolysing)
MLLIAFGTRPEWIKVKHLVKLLEEQGGEYQLLFTGQHTSLIENEIGVPWGKVRKLEVENICENRLDNVFSSTLKNIGDLKGVSGVLVQGDTTSALAVAMAAFHRQVPVFHLEAGMRTFDKNNPYPEEFNRHAISALTDIHFCPTHVEKENLSKCLDPRKTEIHVVGNTVIDNIVDLRPRLEDFVIVTMHRRENHKRMADWFLAVNEASKNSKFRYIFPIHPNPNVQKHKDLLTNVDVIDPVDHKKFTLFLRDCRYAITDSGGIQEELSWLRKKTIVCRENTERALGIGRSAFLCPMPEFLPSMCRQIESNDHYLVKEECPYGDGRASQRVFNILKHHIKGGL